MRPWCCLPFGWASMDGHTNGGEESSQRLLRA
jgi:hypothetical protein